MANILLDYFFPITSIEPTPSASTSFLKQVCLVVNPKSGQEGNVGTIYECVSNAEVAVRTDNTEAAQFFSAGMNKVFILLADHLDLADALEGHESDFYTICISSDFSDADMTTAYADGVITISDYAALVSGTDDVITINGTAFTAQAGAVTLGQATFQAASSDEATAASLAAQINGHATIGALVEATVVGDAVTITAIRAGGAGNDITLAYTDNDTNVGAVLSGLSGGKLAGGAGILLGEFTGVVGVSSNDDATFLPAQAAIANRVAFYESGSNNAKNMCYAFGKMLSNASQWRNQQYITMPYADDVETLGAANALFDDNVSFVISDDEFGERLGLFAAGGKAIVGPYIKRNLEIDMQSAALSFISGNQPQHTLKAAALLEDELQKVIQLYIDRQWIEAGTVEVTLGNTTFVAEGAINISEPTAMWRIFAEMQQTL